jgi:hypothetical protein
MRDLVNQRFGVSSARGHKLLRCRILSAMITFLESATSRRLAAVFTCVSLLASSLPAADASVRWKELPPLVTGRRVWIPLNDGVRLAGTIRVVEPAALLLEVKKTSNRKAYPKGLVRIPRSAISTIRVNKPDGHKGAKVGLAIGVGGGVALGAIANNEGSQAVGATMAGILGLVGAGLGAGWLVDSVAHRSGRTIRIVGE